MATNEEKHNSPAGLVRAGKLRTRSAMHRLSRLGRRAAKFARRIAALVLIALRFSEPVRVTLRLITAVLALAAALLNHPEALRLLLAFLAGQH